MKNNVTKRSSNGSNEWGGTDGSCCTIVWWIVWTCDDAENYDVFSWNESLHWWAAVFLGEKEGGRFAIGSLCSRIPQTSTSRQGDTRTFEEVSGGKLCSLRPWKNDDGNSRHLQRIRHCRLCKQGVTFRTFMMHFSFFSKQGALDNNNKPLCLEIDLVNYSLFFLRRCIRFGDMKNAEFFNQWTLSSGHIRFIPVSLIRKIQLEEKLRIPLPNSLALTSMEFLLNLMATCNPLLTNVTVSCLV